MGFGRSAVTTDEAADDIRALHEQVDDLQAKMTLLQTEINAKPDTPLSRKMEKI